MKINIDKLFRPTTKYIAIDPGTYSIKLSAFTYENGEMNFKIFKYFKFKRENLFKGSNLDDIKNFLEENELLDYKAILVIRGANIIIRYISIPNIPDTEIDSAVKFEAKKELPFSLEECEMDYSIINKDRSTNKIKILLAACKKEDLEQYYSLLSVIGLSPDSIIVNPIVSSNLFELKDKVFSKDCIAHIDIGYQSTSVNILNNGDLEFTRVLPIGSYHVDELLAESLTDNPLNIIETMPKASEIKQAQGLTGPDEEIKKVIKEGINRIIQRIRLSVGYYKTQSGVKKISRILITGGFAVMPGLTEYLSENLEAPVELFSFLQDHSIRFEIGHELNGDSLNTFSTVLGAAYEKFKQNPRINILNKKFRPKKQLSITSQEDIKYLYSILMQRLVEFIPNPIQTFGIIYIILIVLMIIPIFWLNGTKLYYYHRVKKYLKKFQEVDTKLTKAVNLNNEIRKKELIFMNKKSIYTGKKNWAKIFQAMSNLFPETTVIDRLVIKMNKERKYSFSIIGKTIDASTATQAAITLGANKYFKDVKLENTVFIPESFNDKKKKNLNFTITGFISGDSDE